MVDKVVLSEDKLSADIIYTSNEAVCKDVTIFEGKSFRGDTIVMKVGSSRGQQQQQQLKGESDVDFLEGVHSTGYSSTSQY